MSTSTRKSKAPVRRKPPASHAAIGRTEVAAGRRNLPVITTPRAQVPCLTCGLCCSYVAVEIDGPSTLDAATNILWYLYHRDVSVYVDDGEWLIQFETRCQNLEDDNRCSIYETRPPVCRSFDESTCEVNADQIGLTLHSPIEFMTYLQQHHKRIHTLVRKRYWPADGSTPLLPQRKRARLGAFRPRYEALRVLGASN
jgi:Fe-S-cluster containining protein